MKRTFICLLAAFAALAAQARAADSPITEITASGSGSVSLPPDVATVGAGVETNADSASEAVDQNNAIYDRIVSAVTKLGVARDDISLNYYRVTYNPRPRVTSPNSSEERFGYIVARNFSVKVRDIGKAGAITDACLGSGATAIDGVSFGLSDPSAAQTKAVAQAVSDARNSAVALARAVGLRIVRIKSMQFGAAQGSEPLRMARLSSNVTEFDQSNVNVTASVTVVFIAEP